ncbi:prepilin peptidase [Candidatus Saccharibacteria bacterium]|nr:prepilin peptidase [Candidatus Saccharibacteria bacterium]
MLVLLFIFGACIGSFLCCQARRLHLKTSRRKSLGSRSVCLNCGRQLKWYDNLPIISWLLLRGKCRKCHSRIGLAELLSELGVALAFLCIGTTFDIESAGVLDWCKFILLLVYIAIMCFLAIYDGLYGELPVSFLIIAVLLSIVNLILQEIGIILSTGFTFDLVYKPFLSVLILGGLYLVLYLISKGKWVGDGDWILGVAIGLVLFDPWLALIELFLANTIACFVMLPFVLKKRRTKIYFGPFLAIAMVLVLTFSTFIYTIIG